MPLRLPPSARPGGAHEFVAAQRGSAPLRRRLDVEPAVQQARWKPDATFCPSPSLAGEAAPEKLAYVATF